jgi:hypothetical protein
MEDTNVSNDKLSYDFLLDFYKKHNQKNLDRVKKHYQNNYKITEDMDDETKMQIEEKIKKRREYYRKRYVKKKDRLT